MRRLDEQVMISGQIDPSEVPELKRQGITTIINNRPDGEEPGQPLGADIEAAAEQAGVDYHYIPIHRGIGPGYVEAMRDVFHSDEDSRILAFCRTGSRSALAWAVARREEGMKRAEVERRAAEAGIDLTPVAHLL